MTKGEALLVAREAFASFIETTPLRSQFVSSAALARFGEYDRGDIIQVAVAAVLAAHGGSGE